MKTTNAHFKASAALSLVMLVSCSMAPASLAQSWGQFKQAGQTSLEQGNLTEAEKHWTAALGLAEEHGNRDPRFCASIRGLALVYRSKSKFSEAMALYKRVIPNPAGFTPGNEELNNCARDYAILLREQNQIADADALTAALGSAAAPATAVAPASAVNTAATEPTSSPIPKPAAADPNKWAEFMSAGKLQARQKSYVAAEQSFRKALTQLTAFAPSDPRMNQTFTTLTDLYESQGKFAEADMSHHATLQWLKKVRGSMNTDYVDALMKHGRLLRRLNRKTEALAEEGKAEKLHYAVTGGPNQDQDAFQSITSIAGTGSIISGVGGFSAGGGGGSTGGGGGFGYSGAGGAYAVGGFGGGG